MLTDEGLDFLRERSVFWNTLGPLPPPVPQRRPPYRDHTFAGVSSNDSGGGGGGGGVNRELPWKRRQKEQTVVKRDITQVDFRFRSHLSTRERKRQDLEWQSGGRGQVGFKVVSASEGGVRDQWEFEGGLGKGGRRANRTMFVGFDDPEMERRQQLTDFVNEELDLIDDAFKDHDYKECVHKAEVCLRAVSSLPDDDINKSEILASLHSCLGNACIALQKYDEAFQHHTTALRTGEQGMNNGIIARSLGHMGRMYIIQRKFNKALEVFARKAPMCSSLEEVTQTFHEIGNCFLVLGHYDYSRDCGRKALQAAEDADLTFFQQQAWILIAISEAKLQNLKEAYKAFNGALRVAMRRGDKDSQDAISGAMDHLSRRIENLLKKKDLVNQRMILRSKAKALTQDDLPRGKPPTVRHGKRKRRHTVPFSRQPTRISKDKPSDTSKDQAPDTTSRKPRVTEQGVDVTELPSDDEDETELEQTGYDSDWPEKDKEKAVSQIEHQPGTHSAISQVEGEGNAQIPTSGYEEKPQTDKDSLKLDLGHHQNLQDDSVPPTYRDGLSTDRDGLTSRSVQDDQTRPQTDRDGAMLAITDRDGRLVQTERVERDQDRRRFRREATLGTVSVDDTTYQQFARESSFNRASTLRARQIYAGRQAPSRQSLVASRQGSNLSRLSFNANNNGTPRAVSKTVTTSISTATTTKPSDSKNVIGTSTTTTATTKPSDSKNIATVSATTTTTTTKPSVSKSIPSATTTTPKPSTNKNAASTKTSKHGHKHAKPAKKKGDATPRREASDLLLTSDRDRESGDGCSEPDLMQGLQPLPPITPRHASVSPARTPKQETEESKDAKGTPRNTFKDGKSVDTPGREHPQPKTNEHDYYFADEPTSSRAYNNTDIRSRSGHVSMTGRLPETGANRTSRADDTNLDEREDSIPEQLEGFERQVTFQNYPDDFEEEEIVEEVEAAEDMDDDIKQLDTPQGQTQTEIPDYEEEIFEQIESPEERVTEDNKDEDRQHVTETAGNTDKKNSTVDFIEKEDRPFSDPHQRDEQDEVSQASEQEEVPQTLQADSHTAVDKEPVATRDDTVYGISNTPPINHLGDTQTGGAGRTEELASSPVVVKENHRMIGEDEGTLGLVQNIPGSGRHTAEDREKPGTGGRNMAGVSDNDMSARQRTDEFYDQDFHSDKADGRDKDIDIRQETDRNTDALSCEPPNTIADDEPAQGNLEQEDTSTSNVHQPTEAEILDPEDETKEDHHTSTPAMKDSPTDILTKPRSVEGPFYSSPHPNVSRSDSGEANATKAGQEDGDLTENVETSRASVKRASPKERAGPEDIEDAKSTHTLKNTDEDKHPEGLDKNTSIEAATRSAGLQGSAKSLTTPAHDKTDLHALSNPEGELREERRDQPSATVSQSRLPWESGEGKVNSEKEAEQEMITKADEEEETRAREEQETGASGKEEKEVGARAERDTCQPHDDFPSRSQTVASWVQAY